MSPSPACLDGRVMDASEAFIPVTDAGLLRGDGVFEVLRLYAGVPFALEDHLARLAASGANLRLDVDVDAVRADVTALLASASPGEACLRIVLTRGGHRLLLIEPVPDHAPTISLATVTYSPPRILDGVKSLSYGGNMLATRLARERGGDEALLVTPHGRVLEAPTSSFFWVAEGRLCTPPLEDHILASITRARVLDVVEVAEVPCPLDSLADAQEAFIASTTREVHPVSAIDGRALPAAPGPLTSAAAAALHARIERELAVPAA